MHAGLILDHLIYGSDYLQDACLLVLGKQIFIDQTDNRLRIEALLPSILVLLKPLGVFFSVISINQTLTSP